MREMNKKGVSLAELLAVVVIMGIIAAIAIPLVGNVIETSKKKAYLGDLISVTEAVRTYCITEGNEKEPLSPCYPFKWSDEPIVKQVAPPGASDEDKKAVEKANRGRQFNITDGNITMKDDVQPPTVDPLKLNKYISKKIDDIASFHILMIGDGKKYYLLADGDVGKYSTNGKFIDPTSEDAIDYIVKKK